MADILVHPLFPEQSKEHRDILKDKLEIYEDYKKNLEEELSEKQNLILVDAITTETDYCDIPASQKVMGSHHFIYPGDKSKGVYNYGWLHPDSWSKFESLFDVIPKDEDVRIHGAYLNSCVSQFARQLVFFDTFGRKTYNVINRNILKFAFEEQVLLPICEVSGIFKRSRIKYGQVVSPNILEDDAYTIKEPYWRSPFGDLDFQLIDDRTLLYGH